MEEPRSSSFSRRKRKILIAMDGSKHSEFAFKWYAENLHKHSDEVLMAHCTENFHLPSTALVGTNDTSVQELYHQHTAESREVFRKIDELAKHHKIKHTLQHLHGYPGHTIISAAEEQNVDMIVCGSRGLGLIRRTIMGSVSDYVLHHAHIPVIVVKHEDERKKLMRQISQPGKLPSEVDQKKFLRQTSHTSTKSAP